MRYFHLWHQTFVTKIRKVKTKRNCVYLEQIWIIISYNNWMVSWSHCPRWVNQISLFPAITTTILLELFYARQSAQFKPHLGLENFRAAHILELKIGIFYSAKNIFHFFNFCIFDRYYILNCLLTHNNMQNFFFSTKSVVIKIHNCTLLCKIVKANCDVQRLFSQSKMVWGNERTGRTY